MTQPRRQILIVVGVGTLSSFAAVAFLLPKGEPLAYTALSAALFLYAAVAVAYVYALWGSAPAPERNETLRPQVDVYTLEKNEYAVSAALLDGEAPLVAIVHESELLHPEFVERLAPYFADPALAWVQTATHYQGTGRVADAFLAQESLAYSAAEGKNSLNAAALRGSGAMIAREALQAAYYPGISFEELGLRLQALGYATYFETTPLVLARAPHTMHEYWPLMLKRAVQALRLAAPALYVRRLPFATRAQYISSAAAYAAIGASALAIVFAPLAFVVRGTGPLIVSSVALPGLVFVAAAVTLAVAALAKVSRTPVMTAAALATIGAYAASYAGARAAIVQARAGYAWVMTMARGDGSASTAPAGNPARS